MSQSVFVRFPDIKGFSFKFTNDVTLCTAYLRNGTKRPMTELEIQWERFPPDTDIETLEALNSDEAGAPLCESCNRFHPDLAPYHNNGWLICPVCRDEADEQHMEMYREYYRNVTH